MTHPNKLPRYNVSPSDDGSSIEDQARSRSWDIIDRVTGHSVENHLTRKKARDAAREMNIEAERYKMTPLVMKHLGAREDSAMPTTNANAGGDRPSK